MLEKLEISLKKVSPFKIWNPLDEAFHQIEKRKDIFVMTFI